MHAMAPSTSNIYKWITKESDLQGTLEAHLSFFFFLTPFFIASNYWSLVKSLVNKTSRLSLPSCLWFSDHLWLELCLSKTYDPCLCMTSYSSLEEVCAVWLKATLQEWSPPIFSNNPCTFYLKRSHLGKRSHPGIWIRISRKQEPSVKITGVHYCGSQGNISHSP